MDDDLGVPPWHVGMTLEKTRVDLQWGICASQHQRLPAAKRLNQAICEQIEQNKKWGLRWSDWWWFMDMYGDLWIFMVICGYLWILMVILMGFWPILCTKFGENGKSWYRIKNVWKLYVLDVPVMSMLMLGYSLVACFKSYVGQLVNQEMHKIDPNMEWWLVQTDSLPCTPIDFGLMSRHHGRICVPAFQRLHGWGPNPYMSPIAACPISTPSEWG